MPPVCAYLLVCWGISLLDPVPGKKIFLMFTLPAGAVVKVNVIFTSCQPPTLDQHAQPAPAHTDHLLSSHSLFHLCFPSLACLFTCHWDTLRLPSNRSVEARSRWNKLNYLPSRLLAHTAIRSRHLASQRTISESMSPFQTPLLYCTCSKERCVKEV